MDKNIVNINIASVWWCLNVLSNIWSSIHEKVKQHWVWVEKERCLSNENVIYFHMENEINENHLQLSFKLFVKLSW